MGVAKVDAGPERSTLQFVKSPPFDPGALIRSCRSDGRIRFAGPDRVRIERAAPTLADRVALVRDFLGQAALTTPAPRMPALHFRRSCTSSSATGCRRTTSC